MPSWNHGNMRCQVFWREKAVKSAFLACDAIKRDALDSEESDLFPFFDLTLEIIQALNHRGECICIDVGDARVFIWTYLLKSGNTRAISGRQGHRGA
jgi:hypothetical protein